MLVYLSKLLCIAFKGFISCTKVIIVNELLWSAITKRHLSSGIVNDAIKMTWSKCGTIPKVHSDLPSIRFPFRNMDHFVVFSSFLFKFCGI